MDILKALNDQRRERGEHRCNLAQWLHSIPEDTEGRDELIRLVDTPHDRYDKTADTRSALNMARVLTSLGYPITQNPILDHRNGDCACYR